MSIKLPRPVLFIFSFLFLLFLYWPSLQGTPIWDDLTFWFADRTMKPEISYLFIWQRYAWPFSVSLQKLLLSWWHKNFLLYHLFNIGLHFANSLLVYRLARMVRFRYPFILYLLFLLHPTNVITTAWMIQIKTLLCFFFGLASLITFLKGQNHFRWMVFSWFLFALSILSKSASITLPIIFLVISFKQYRFSKLHFLIPFFLLSAMSTYRVLNSEVTKTGTEKATAVIQVKAEPVPTTEAPVEPKVAPKKTAPKTPPVPMREKKVTEEIKKAPEAPVPSQEPNIVIPEKVAEINNTDMEQKNWPSLAFIKIDGELILQTLNYYFWQTLLPFDNAPVKGLNYEHAGYAEYLHLFFLLTLVIIFFKDINLYYLIAGHFLLIPFLGIMPAPYMNITWVSDQHLYLALPCFLFFWMRMIEKIKWKESFLIPLTFCAFFSFKSFESSSFYKNEIAFFEKSLEYNPYNIPIAYNLAYTYLLHHNVQKAHTLLESTIILAQSNPAATKNIYFKHLAALYIQVQEMIHAN